MHDKTDFDECFERCGSGRGDRFDNDSSPGATGRLLPRTCRDVRTFGNTVSAVCRRMDGSWERTEVSGCRGPIANMNGHLTCGGREGYGSSFGPGYDRDHYDRDYRGPYDRGPYPYGR